MSHMDTQASSELPLGATVENTNPSPIPTKKTYTGEFVKLHPVEPEDDVDELFLNSHGSDVKERIWTYMPYGPFSKKDEMLDWLKGCKASTNMSFFTVISKELNQRVGMMSILNVIQQMKTLELGNIWYSPIVHFTKVNTEVVYLMLKEIFDKLDYRCVEWKCDSLNARSRAAALRLGFGFEGIFRQHYIIKNRNRDTAWFAMIDKDWSDIKANMKKWLYAGDSDISLSTLNKRLLTFNRGDFTV
jgi:RimJ/RimL family protein N-acetyltransferase